MVPNKTLPPATQKSPIWKEENGNTISVSNVTTCEHCYTDVSYISKYIQYGITPQTTSSVHPFDCSLKKINSTFTDATSRCVVSLKDVYQLTPCIKYFAFNGKVYSADMRLYSIVQSKGFKQMVSKFMNWFRNTMLMILSLRKDVCVTSRSCWCIYIFKKNTMQLKM